MSNQTDQSELDFNTDDFNEFYYTCEKQIRKMDDEFLLSKITEKYPDLYKTKDENILKQVIVVIVNDTKLIKEFEEDYDVQPTELFKLLYRNYEFIFNKCFITKISRTIKNKAYAKRAAKGGRTNPKPVQKPKRRTVRRNRSKASRKVL